METTKELFKISVSVTGIKKRCRKTEFHLLQGGYIPYNEGTFAREAVEAVARGLIETNMKEVNGKIVINLTHIKQDDHFERWEPFSIKNRHWQLVSPLENELN
jgi:KaiC/GvpD/RAD55 family RecA-like ATPase